MPMLVFKGRRLPMPLRDARPKDGTRVLHLTCPSCFRTNRVDQTLENEPLLTQDVLCPQGCDNDARR
jgi:hypothetical protein